MHLQIKPAPDDYEQSRREQQLNERANNNNVKNTFCPLRHSVNETNKQTKIQLAEIEDSDCFALTSTFFRTHNDNTAINIGIAVCPIFSPSSASFFYDEVAAI